MESTRDTELDTTSYVQPYYLGVAFDGSHVGPS